MRYATIGELKQRSSRIVLGTDCLQDARIGMSVFNAAFDMGINTFDSARSYGSECVLGEWLRSRKLRSEVVLITKGGYSRPFTQQQIRMECDASLQALGSGHIDLYLLHYDCPSMAVEDMVATLDDLRQQGKILSFGLSNFRCDRAQSAAQYCSRRDGGKLRVVSAHYGLIPWTAPYWPDAQTLAGPAKQSDRAWYVANDYSILAYSPLGRGFVKAQLHPRAIGARDDSPENRERYQRACQVGRWRYASPAQVALAFLMQQGPRVFPIIGTQNALHLQQNVAAVDIELTPDECAWLNLETESDRERFPERAPPLSETRSGMFNPNGT